MVKITSKLYRPSDLIAVINALEDILLIHPNSNAANIVIDLRKLGFKIVKVDDGENVSVTVPVKPKLADW